MEIREDCGKSIYNWNKNYPINPLPVPPQTEIFIGIDPSKSGAGIVIENICGEIIKIYQFCGTKMDTSEYCQEFSIYLSELLKNYIIIDVGIENTIMKKGQAYYHSQQVLTEIRGVMIQTFMNILGNGRKPVMVNNSLWKGAILPNGYRSRSEKGSLRYAREINPYIFNSATDNETDAWCICEFIRTKNTMNERVLCCSKEEIARHEIKIKIVNKFNLPEKYIEFRYNDLYSLHNNCSYVTNRSNSVLVAKINENNLTYEEIYKYTKGVNFRFDMYLICERSK